LHCAGSQVKPAPHALPASQVKKASAGSQLPPTSIVPLIVSVNGPDAPDLPSTMA
jgi:hypothetical protein